MELIDQDVIDQGIVLSQEQKLKAVEKCYKRAIHGDIKEMDDETIFKVFCIGNRLVKDKRLIVIGENSYVSVIISPNLKVLCVMFGELVKSHALQDM